MFVSTGEILQSKALPDGQRRSHAPRRTDEPLRRHSRLKGRCEGLFYRRMTRQDARQIVLGAKKYDRVCREAGKRNGPLGHVALEVLEYLCNLVDYRTGRLDPSYDYLMEKLHRSRDAIHRALKALRAHGFLDWIRRYVPTGSADGPQVQQTSNAYRLALPAIVLRLLGRYGKAAPVPDDALHAAQERAAMVDVMRASLTMPEQIALDFGAGDPLGATFARIWEGIQKRESAKQTESQSKVL